MKNLMLSVLICLTLLVASCSSGDTNVTDIQVTVYPGSSYPQPGIDSAALTAYPSYPTFEPYPFKTSRPNTATIHGILLIYNPHITRPVEDGLFLVPFAEDASGGAMGLPQFTVGEVPQAEIDERTGEFYFTNILPGRYMVMVLTTGKAQVPVLNFNDDSFVVIIVDETDMGQTIELNYIRLP